MKNNRRFLAISLVVVSFLLSGCGTPLYELTADEEALIVKYAAHFVAKHNVYQKDGISIEVAEDESSKEETQEPEDTQKPSQGETDKSLTVAQGANLPKGISLKYDGCYVADHIKEGAAYSEEAGEGYTFYIMKFQMKNTTEEAIQIDNFDADIVFKLTSGSLVVKSKSHPFLSTELTSYMGTLDAGEQTEVILVFKVKKADAEKISSPSLEIVDGDTTKPIKF